MEEKKKTVFKINFLTKERITIKMRKSGCRLSVVKTQKKPLNKS